MKIKLFVVTIMLLVLTSCRKGEESVYNTPREITGTSSEVSAIYSTDVLQRLYYDYSSVNWRKGWRAFTEAERIATGARDWKEWRLRTVEQLEWFLWEHDYDMYRYMSLYDRAYIIEIMEEEIPEHLKGRLVVRFEKWNGREMDDPEGWEEEKHDFVFTLKKNGDWATVWSEMSWATKDMYDANNSSEFEEEVMRDLDGAMEHYRVTQSRTMTRKAALRIKHLIEIYMPPWVYEVMDLTVIP